MRYIVLSATFQAKGELSFPQNPVNTLRGALGYQLKRSMCFQRSRDQAVCHGCPGEAHCLYAACFETGGVHVQTKTFNALAQSAGKLARNADIPHLMTFEARFSGPSRFQGGDRFLFGITLFGRAVEAVPWVVQGLQDAAGVGFTVRRVPCELDRIVDAGTGAEVFLAADGVVRPPKPSQTPVVPVDLGHLSSTGGDVLGCRPDGDAVPGLSANQRVTIEFRTPVSFKDKTLGKAVARVEFRRLVGSLLRRLTAFRAVDGLPPPDLDFKTVLALAEQVRVVDHNLRYTQWERFSTRQESRIRLGGVTGRVTFEGPVKPFLPLLQIGEIIRVGRGTSFGQGQIFLVPTIPDSNSVDVRRRV